MSVYVIAGLTIKDAVRFEDYRQILLPKRSCSMYDPRTLTIPY
jgi:hypothetical protein